MSSVSGSNNNNNNQNKTTTASAHNGFTAGYLDIRNVIVMVGLPARGKTYMAKKLTRYLNWIGISSRVFNVGEYRRKATVAFKHHDFFRHDNVQALEIRSRCAQDALNDLCKWLGGGEGRVAVYDATNTTKERRKLIYEQVVGQHGFRLFFIESICDDPTIIEANVREIKIHGPDYKEVDKDEALSDFLKRIEHYKIAYQKINDLDGDEESKYSYMQIFRAGEKVLVHRSEGYVQSRVVYYLMNINILPGSIYFTRHGESFHNLAGRIGGDTELSQRGWQYSKALAKYIHEQQIPNLRVWTSNFTRTLQTAQDIQAPVERWKALNEIDAGICEEMTYEEIKDKYPNEFAARNRDKFHYRYPKGESYEDLVARLEPVIMELERHQNILVIAHQAVLRCLLAYFLDKSSDEIPYIKVPLHNIIKLSGITRSVEMIEPLRVTDNQDLS